MEQTQVQPADHETDEAQPAEAKDLRDTKLADDVDAMLEEIDGVLEENAEEFVSQYIQKGGQ